MNGEFLQREIVPFNSVGWRNLNMTENRDVGGHCGELMGKDTLFLSFVQK